MRKADLTHYVGKELSLPYNMSVQQHIKKVKKALGLDPEVAMTEEEILEAARKRVELIDKEFAETFKFIIQYPKSVTFFGSSRLKENNPHYIKAEFIAKRLSELGFTIVTGGGPGIMEAANRGAYEARGTSVGFNIKLPHEQQLNKYATAHLEYYYFFARKVALSFAAEAFIFFPGGFGTLNEFYEILTLVQTGRVLPMPIILVGKDYWDPIHELMRNHLYKRHQTISEKDFNLYTITDDDDHIIELVKNAPIVRGIDFPDPVNGNK